jgi:hypothetical protein
MICPFCGVITDVPHENQEACIEALNVEISRMRTILETVRNIGVPGPPPANPSEEEPEKSGF